VNCSNAISRPLNLLSYDQSSLDKDTSRKSVKSRGAGGRVNALHVMRKEPSQKKNREGDGLGDRAGTVVGKWSKTKLGRARRRKSRRKE